MTIRPTLVSIFALAACTQTSSAPENSAPAATNVAAASTTASNDVAIDGPAARQAVANGAVLVDVRTPDEFSQGHIEGARNIPVGDVRNRATELPKDKTIIVYCRSGHRAGEAQKTLASMGYQARNLGGMSNWGSSK